MSKLFKKIKTLKESSKDCSMKEKLDSMPKDIKYTLEKTADKNLGSMVSAGYKVSGNLEYSLLEDGNGEYFLICVANAIDYLRPSYLKCIVDETEDSITFESQGGFYKLSWSKE